MIGKNVVTHAVNGASSAASNTAAVSNGAAHAVNHTAPIVNHVANHGANAMNHTAMVHHAANAAQHAPTVCAATTSGSSGFVNGVKKGGFLVFLFHWWWILPVGLAIWIVWKIVKKSKQSNPVSE